MEKAIIYTRKSRDDDGNTLDMQRERLTMYCKMNNLEVVELIVEHGVSGSIPLNKRLGGKKALEIIKQGNATHIVALKLDRLFRNTIDCLTWTNEWDKNNIALHLVEMGGQSINTKSSVGRLFITLLSSFGQFERDTIAERTSASLQHRKHTGKVYNHVPYGYDREDHDLVQNPVEQAVIARMVAMRGSGDTYASIASQLNQEGIRGKKDGKWYQTTVSNVISYQEDSPPI